MRSLRWFVSLPCILVFGALGCDYGAEALHVVSPDKYTANGNDKGMVAGASLLSPSESKKYLDHDLTDGWEVVLVVIENKGSEMLLIQNHDFTLSASEGKTVHAVEWTAPYRMYENDVASDSVLLGVAASGEQSANEDMAHDWSRKSWPEQFMLKPSQRRGSLVFFPHLAGTPPYFIHVEAAGAKTNATTSVDLQLSQAKK